MSFFKSIRLKGSKHYLKKGDTFINNIEETTGCFDLNQRDLIVYHIDSETEGTYSLTVRVSSDLSSRLTLISTTSITVCICLRMMTREMWY